MNSTRTQLFALIALALLLGSTGCSDRDVTGLAPARGHVDPVVFDDDYGSDVYFQAFSQTHVTAVSLDSVYAYGGFAADGARALKVNIPPAGSSLGLYSGGVLTAGQGRNMSDFNALTFYARSSAPISLDVAGFANDNTGNSLYEAGRANVRLTSDWTFVIVPIPASTKLLSERGMFTFAEGLEAPYPQGYDIWFDEIRYAHLDNITNPQPFMPSSNKQYFVGSTATLSGTHTRFDVDGAPVTVDHMPGYFDFTSSNPAVAEVANDGIRVVGVGDATVTATLADVPVDGEVVLTGFLPPTGTATAPTAPANEVISLFSAAYADEPVDSWNTHWNYSTAEDEIYMIGDHQTRMYSALNFVGIDFSTHKIDASAMAYFHVDVFAPFGSDFSVKLVAFSATGTLLGQAEVTLDETTTPAFAAGVWSSLDIPMSDFNFVPPSTAPTASLAQLVFSTSDAKLVLVDNIYWHQ